MNVEYLGNKELLKLKKTSFLASSTVSSYTVLIRNRYVCEMANEILFVGVTEQSSLNVLRRECENKQNNC